MGISIPFLILSFFFLAALTPIAGASEDPPSVLREKALQFHSPIPSSPPALPEVALTPERVDLGKFLYFDPRLSLSNQISCNSCHNLSLGGSDGQAVSLGHQWQLDDRNAPTTLNSVLNFKQFWDGHAANLVDQAHDPIVDSKEMASQEKDVEKTISSIPSYVEMFKTAFPDDKNPLSMRHVQEAIAIFETTLLTPNSPYDKFLKGDDSALSSKELAGLELFIDVGCASCHDGPGMGGTQFRKFGEANDPGEKYRPPNDTGRFEVTNDEADLFVYKVPLLRNINLTAPYFHTGSTWDLGEAVRVMGKAQLDIDLTDDEVSKIVEFLKTLTGDQPKIVLPILPPGTAATPLPQP